MNSEAPTNPAEPGPDRPGLLSRTYGVLRDIYIEVDRHLPVWFAYLMAWGLLKYEIAHVAPEEYLKVGIERHWFILTIIFPLFWIFLYYGARIYASVRIRRKGLAFALLALFFIGHPLSTYLYRMNQPKVLSPERMTMIYEYSQFFWVGILILHALLSRGWANIRSFGLHRVVTFFGGAYLYGLMLENSGIIMGLFLEPQYTWYLGWSERYYLPAPICTQLGWCICFYLAIWITESLSARSALLRKGVLLPALMATAVAISIDLQVDPMASLSGVWWSWDPRLEPWYLGVPFINYASWFGAFVPFCYAYFYYKRREDYSPGRRNFEIFIRLHYIILISGVISFGIMYLYEGGTGGPTFEILRDFLDRVLPYH